MSRKLLVQSHILRHFHQLVNILQEAFKAFYCNLRGLSACIVKKIHNTKICQTSNIFTASDNFGDDGTHRKCRRKWEAYYGNMYCLDLRIWEYNLIVSRYLYHNPAWIASGKSGLISQHLLFPLRAAHMRSIRGGCYDTS